MSIDSETKKECPHCGTSAAAGMMKRWHGDNCKQKPKDIVVEQVETLDKTKGENEMSLFVEVNSLEKGCPVIINIDHVIEIAPLLAGGCALFMTDGSNKISINVSDSYEMFRQFAVQTVSADDIAKRIAKLKG